jgi:rhamnosyltransferase
MGTGQSDPGTGVCAVMVTFLPDLGRLSRAVAAVGEQVEQVLVVDNGSSPRPAGHSANVSSNVTYVELAENIGLASAQNWGVAWARARGFSHVLFMDQDSIVDQGAVATLRAASGALEDSGEKVGAVGPRQVDERTGESIPFVQFRRLMLWRHRCETGTEIVPCGFLISSGSLISMRTLQDVGGLEDDLFIDNVDLEWSFRAVAKGYRLFGVCGAILEHVLGDDVVHVWPGGRYRLYRHGPLRQYYISRNRLVLYRRKYSPSGWILQDSIRFVFKLIMFGLVLPPRRENLRMIVLGMRDALAGRMGRLTAPFMPNGTDDRATG